MPFENRVVLPGSEREPMPGTKVAGTLDLKETVSVSVILSRKGSDPAPAGLFLTHAELTTRYGAKPEHINLVEEFATKYNLSVSDASAQKRRVTLTGTLEDLAHAFDAQLHCYEHVAGGFEFRGRTGPLKVPTELKSAVVAVLGLDSRPVAKPHFQKRKHKPKPKPTPTPTPTEPEPFNALQVGELYQYPAGADGSGETIAILELGGGFRTADLSHYFKKLNVKEPKIIAVSVDKGKNKPGSDADGEVMLDIEVAGALAPGANFVVYFAPNTDQGFVDAITDAVHDQTHSPSILSISWGGPEDSWTEQGRQAMNAALQDAATLGVTVTVAAGDNGSSDGVTDGKFHVDFPAASPWVLACGGTTLLGSGSSITSETVWNETAKREGATGGGISTLFPVPSYQSAARIPKNPNSQFAGRGVPDVAGVADPSTGYEILVDGQSEVVGGTSAVAPQWAALVAILNQKLGKRLGFINPALYALAGKTAFHDITSGNNDDSNLGQYKAAAGWDACTGLGTPNGTALLGQLQSSSGTSTGS